MQATLVSQPPMRVERTYPKGGSYMDGQKELAANGERYPTIMAIQKRRIDMGRTPYKKLKAAAPSTYDHNDNHALHYMPRLWAHKKD